MNRSIVLFTLALFSCIISCAQSFDSAVRYRMSPSFYSAADSLISMAITADPSDTGEGGKANTLLIWKNFMGSRISLDVQASGDMYAPMKEALLSYRTYFDSYCPVDGFGGNWKCIGPYTTINPSGRETQGRVVSIWANSLTGTILAGADGGGLWKSTNDGHSWHNITDGTGAGKILGMPAVNSIAVDPLDTNKIYGNDIRVAGWLSKNHIHQ